MTSRLSLARNSILALVTATVAPTALHCSSSDARPNTPSTGGAIGAGGLPALTGGAGGSTTPSGGSSPASGGATASGGTGPLTSGGNTASGGIDNSGGQIGAGAITSSGGASPDGGDGPRAGPFPPVTDFQKDGPYTAKTVNDAGPGGTYTVYLPQPLGPDGLKNPIVGWMSGGATTPAVYPLLPRLATHGFVVVASNTAPGIGAEVELGQEIIAGIDWAIAENGREGGEMKDKLDTTKIASMGYSMGSLATFTIANDPRLTTTVHISGGNMQADRIGNLRAPAAFICGIPGDASCNILSTSCDIAAANCDTDFAGAKVPVFYANFPAGHLGILTAGLGDEIGATAIAWLRFKLMADTTLSSNFIGPDCTVCKKPNWKVQTKNLP
jgi:hypothetical protein